MSNQVETPSLWLEFDQHGRIDTDVVAQLTSLLNKPEIADIVLMVHGWKYDKIDAAKLYGTLWENTRVNLPHDREGQIVVIGALWPAKAFRTDFDEAALAEAHSGNTLSAPGGAAVNDLSEQEFEDLLTEFGSLVGPSAATIIAAAARRAAKALTADASHALVREGMIAVRIDTKSPDSELAGDAAPFERARGNATDAQLLLNKLAQPPLLKLSAAVGNVMGLGTVVQGQIAGSRAAVGRFLNQLTYYEMKKRAGVVGVSLADSVLANLAPARPIRLHLVGHSFGARLVTAAVNRWEPTSKVEVFSLTILQGAFSHNAFAAKVRPGLAGAFPSVISKPTGPIAITHTHNDLACTIAYALASRLSRDITQGIGDASDEFGSMGANGPQKLDPGVAEPDDAAQAFAPKRRKINTFLGDHFIVKTHDLDAHNNITNRTVGRLLAKTILA
ncbi:hypothetical protein [Bradyrhizobium diazoefficiens]